MRIRVLLFLSTLTVLAVAAAPLRAADKVEAPNPTKLVDRLGSTEFAERQQAAKALETLGEPALAALKAGLKADDLEVRCRCSDLLAKLERRLESARLVQPKRVQLNFKDVPLTEAVADFGRKTGFAIELTGDTTKVAGRKITLDTGLVTFWEALDQFCAQAGLIEVGLAPTPAAPKPGSPEEQLLQLKLQQQGMAIRTRYYDPYQQAGPDLTKVLLTDGKMPALASNRSSALRIRQLPNSIQVAGLPGGDGERTIPLEVTPEPGLAWVGLTSIRVEKAIDDLGQTLVQPSLFVGGQVFDPFNPYQQVQIWNGNMMYSSGGGGTPFNPTHVPLRLKAADRKSKEIKEMRGTVTGQVQTPPEPLITVEKVLEAAGKTTEGSNGGQVKVIDIKREASGQYRVKVLVEAPVSDGSDTVMMGGFGGRQVRINRAVFAMKAGMVGQQPVDPATLELRDDKGGVYQSLGVQATNQGQVVQLGAFGAAPQEMELLYQPNANQGPPAKLVLIGRRTVTIEVPFTLENVTLQ